MFFRNVIGIPEGGRLPEIKKKLFGLNSNQINSMVSHTINKLFVIWEWEDTHLNADK